MTSRWPWERPTEVGVAIARDRVVAVVPGAAPKAPWIRDLAPPGDSDSISPGLAAALGELRAALAPAHAGAAGSDSFRGVLHVALLPPLGEIRRIELPGLKLAEARQVLRREPSRYLARSADAPPLELEVEGEGWWQASPFTLFAASKSIIDGIHAAARESGWSLGGIVPAEGALAAAALAITPASKDAERTLVVCFDDRVEIIHARGDRPITVRRFPLAVDSPPLVQAIGWGAQPASPGVVTVVGASRLADQLRLTLANDADGARPAAAGMPAHESPALLAARYAPRAAGPLLLPEGERAIAEQKSRRANVARFAAAAALLAAAAVLQLWGLSREQSAIATERARLRVPVTHALAVRDSLAQVADRLSVIRGAATTSPRWTPLLVALSSRLPDDAFLLSLRADGDSLRLEGTAARAEGVFDALRDLHGISALRPDGPIRQEIDEDGSMSERFTVAARVVREP